LLNMVSVFEVIIEASDSPSVFSCSKRASIFYISMG